MSPALVAFLRLALAAVLLTGVSAAEKKAKAARATPRPDAPRPNVVLLIADDLGYGEPGFQGGRDVPTPNLDQIGRAHV